MASFDPSGLNLTYESLADEKAKALKAVLRQWGLTLRRALRQESNLSTRSNLYRAISFRVEPQSKRDLNGKIRLLVGILDPSSPVLKYLKFVLHGTRKHFVPMQYHGRSTGIFDWAKSKGLIRRNNKGKWVWVKGNLQGQQFRGIPNAGNKPNNFFKRVYDRYDNDIKRDIQRVLEG